MAELSTITSGTKVTFPMGATSGVSEVLLAWSEQPGTGFIVVAETPFYPVSHTWPDQQADHGSIEVAGRQFNVVDTITGALPYVGDSDRVYLDSHIPVRKFDPMWFFLVTHVVEVPMELAIEDLTGERATLTVDPERRRLLSGSHSATHLAGLALNKHTAQFWRKDVDCDSIGHPDLDKLAMEHSTIGPGLATDRYRFGKSLRKKGFDSLRFFETIGEVSALVNAQVRDWLSTNQRVVIECAGETLDAARAWTCELDERHVNFPCGGTHIQSFAELAAVEVSFKPFAEEQEVVMQTVPDISDRT